MSTSMTTQALNAYRHGLRAARIAFGQDTRLLLAARQKMREGMRSPENPELPIEKQVQLMEDVALFLRRNIVQGERTGTTRDGEKPTYHLNLHKDSELGDNDEIKQGVKRNTLVPGGSAAVGGAGGCCGGGSVPLKEKK